MARMYFGFKTNAPDSIEKVPTVQVEHITFKLKDGSTANIGCDGWSDFGVTDGVYSARFKGLEYEVEDKNGKTILEYGEEPTDDQLKAIEEAKPVSILFYWEDGFNVPKDFKPKCQDIEITVEHNTENHEYNMEFSAKELECEVC